MTTKLYYNAFIPAFSNIGVPVANARLYFYYTTTTELAPIYADAAATTPLENPVEANIAGKYPDIYLDNAILYRVFQTTSTGVPLGDAVDPYYPGTVVSLNDPGLRADLAANDPTQGAALVGLPQGGTVAQALNYVTPEMFGAVGNGTTNDRAAVQAAITAAIARNVPVAFISSYLVSYASASEVIQLPSNLKMNWLGGEIVFNTFGLPAFYNLSNFGFIRSAGSMRFRWSGTIPTGSPPAVSNSFVINLYNAGLTGNFNGCRDNVGALLFCGTNFRHEGTASFVATDFTNVNKAMPLGIAALQGISGTRCRVEFTGSLFFDGLLMGIQSFNVERFTTGDISSFRWGQLDLNVYPHSLPGHVFYFTPDLDIITEVRVGNCYDTGIAMTGTDYSWGSASYKTSGHPLVFIAGDLISERPAGLANIHCGSGSVGVMKWKGATTWSEYSANRAFTIGGGSVTGTNAAEKIAIKGLYIEAPADDQGGCTISGNNVDIQAGRWTCATTDYLSNNLISIIGTNHTIKIDYDLPNIPFGKFTVLATFNAGASNNRIKTLVNCADWANARFIENAGTVDNGNVVEIEHKASGSTRKIADGVEHLSVIDVMTQTVTASPTTVTSGLYPGSVVFPKGSIKKGVVSRVQTALTGTATGYQLGDGTTATLYADKTGLTVGTQTTASDLATNALGQTPADQNIVITGKGGTLTGGVIKIRAMYDLVIASPYTQ